MSVSNTRVALLLSALVLIARGQFGNSGNTAFSFTQLCNGSFDQANATGLYYYNPHVDQGRQVDQPDNNYGKTQDIGIAFTVTETNISEIAATTWIWTNGANYSDDFALGYDVCGMNFGPFPNNTNYRGQLDNGSCTTMFDQDCVNAIELQVQNYALELTSHPTPGPNSNLTASSLEGVCSSIADNLKDNIPKECLKFVDSSTTVGVPTALTGYNASAVYALDCTIKEDNRTWWQLLTQYADYSTETYSLFTQTTTPVIAIWMPIANYEAPSTIQTAKAGMICVNANNFTEGSVKPAALPSPTPVGSGGGGLSGGAIAGIVVGVVIGVALIAGLLAWWFIVKRRKTRKNAANVDGNGHVDEKDGVPVEGFHGDEVANGSLNPSPVMAEAPANKPLAELPDQDKRPELDGSKDQQIFESDAKIGAPAVELEGSSPVTKG